MITYAHLKQVQRAILIYPQYPPTPLDQLSHGLYLQSLCFGLDDSLETAGQKFLKSPYYKNSKMAIALFIIGYNLKTRSFLNK